MESNKYIKNEIKLLKSIDDLKERQIKFEKIKKEYENKEYIEKFSEDEINNIKDLIKILKIEH